MEAMLGPEEVTAMLRLNELGWGAKKIARELGVSRNTVKDYIAAGGWTRRSFCGESLSCKFKFAVYTRKTCKLSERKMFGVIRSVSLPRTAPAPRTCERSEGNRRLIECSRLLEWQTPNLIAEADRAGVPKIAAMTI